ncbi:unnamed protein product, partial [Echinostoma caproni]|uniref:Centrosomal protein of 192 kDa-like n=1 Tax=Echinostoma caproni TaxID=27848 RepID=A0A183B138_9TREM
MDCGASMTAVNDTVNLDEDSNNSLVKDDLITLAWRLTQMKGQEVNNTVIGDNRELIGSNEDGDGKDAADLESVLGPDADRLSAADHVSDSFLQSLVNDSPGLALGSADDDDADADVETARLFDSDFGVCVTDDPLDDPAQTTNVNQQHTGVSHQGSSCMDSATQFELDLEAFAKSDCPLDTSASGHSVPVPSSQQVRSLFQNSSNAHHHPANRSRGLPCDLSRTMSAESKLLGLFGSGTRRHGSKTHRSTQEDDFLAVDFADADGDYTTAEQFNEALLLLGPQPNSPVELSLTYDKSIKEPCELQPPQETHETEPQVKPADQTENHAPETTALMDQLPSIVPNSPRRLTYLSEQEICIDLECFDCESEDDTVSERAVVTITTEDVSSKCLRPLMETTVAQSPKLCTFQLPLATVLLDTIEQTEPVMHTFPEITKIEVYRSSEQDTVHNASNPTTPTQLMESVDIPQDSKSVEVSSMILESRDTKSGDSDEEATLAMRLDSNQIPAEEHVFNTDSAKNQHYSSVRRSIPRNVRPAKRQFRARSISLATPLELAASTPTRVSRNRRRLLSAPSQIPPLSAVLRHTRQSSTRYASLKKTDSDDHPSISGSDSQKLSPQPHMAAVPSTEQSSHLSADESATEPMQAQSILTVLASSSALLEAAADLGSESDVSPVKSSLGLDTLDRMLKNCQKRSQQALCDTTDSKSSLVSSLESDATGGSQTATGQSTVPMTCLGTEQDRSIASEGASTEPDAADTTSLSNWTSITDCDRETTSKPIVSDVDGGSHRRRRRVVGRRSKKTISRRRKQPERVQASEGTRSSETDQIRSDSVELEFTYPTEKNTLLTPTSDHASSDALRASSIDSMASNLPLTGFLFCSSERPHSFGLSSESMAAIQSANNSVPIGDFSQHLPQLTLAQGGPLFPDLPPSPTDVLFHECDLCKSDSVRPIETNPDPVEQLNIEQRHEPQPLERVHHGRLKSKDSPSIQPAKAQAQSSGFFNSTTVISTTSRPIHSRVPPPHRRRRKRSGRSRSAGKVSHSTLESTETHTSLCPPRSAFDLAIITPINLKKPSIDAPFARFAVNPELPTFADVQTNGLGDAFARKSDGPPIWDSGLCPGAPLFVNTTVKTSESEQNKMETHSLSPTALIDTSSEVAETSSDRVSLSSTAFHDDEKPNPTTSCCLSDLASFSPHLTIASSTGSLSLFDQSIGTFPVLRIPPFGQMPSLSVIATSQLPKTGDMGAVALSTPSPAASLATPPSLLAGAVAFNTDAVATIPGLKLPTATGLSSLSITTTTRVPGSTFGSFAGAAAFRATSFSALAAKAESSSDKSKGLLWTERLTFSDLAKVACQSDLAKPLASNRSNVSGWGQETEQSENRLNGLSSVRLFQNYTQSDPQNNSDSGPASQHTSDEGEQSTSLLLSTSVVVNGTSCELAVSSTSDLDPPSPSTTNLFEPTDVSRREPKPTKTTHSSRKGSRRRRGSRKASQSIRKHKTSQLVPDFEQGFSLPVNPTTAENLDLQYTPHDITRGDPLSPIATHEDSIPLSVTKEDSTPILDTQKDSFPPITTHEDPTPPAAEDSFPPLDTREHSLSPTATQKDSIQLSTTNEAPTLPLKTHSDSLSLVATHEDSPPIVSNHEESPLIVRTDEDSFSPVANHEDSLLPATIHENSLPTGLSEPKSSPPKVETFSETVAQETEHVWEAVPAQVDDQALECFDAPVVETSNTSEITATEPKTDSAPLGDYEVSAIPSTPITNEPVSSPKLESIPDRPESTSPAIEPVVETLPVASLCPEEDATCITNFDVTHSPVDEIITLPLDQEDCIALAAEPESVTNSNDAHDASESENLLTPSKGLELSEDGINEVGMHSSETEPDPTPSTANAEPSREEDESTHPKSSSHSDTEAPNPSGSTDHNPCPPIRLRLNLKLATVEHSQSRGKKTKKSKRRHAQKIISALPMQHQNSPMTAVVSARTPTSLSIRLAPRPKITRLPVTQRILSLNPPESQTRDSIPRRARSRRAGHRGPRSRSDRGISSVPDSTTVTVQNAAVAWTSNNPSTTTHSNTQVYTVVPNATRSVSASRSSAAGPVSRTGYPPRLGSVFAKKIFSTAKQDRRSSYAHLAQPWRSSMRGSPRKRGLSRPQSGAPMNKPSGSVSQPGPPTTDPKTAPALPVPSTSPAIRGIIGRRGRRGSGRGRGRLSKRALSVDTDLSDKRVNGHQQRSIPSADPPAIRLVIRLGKHVQQTQSMERVIHNASSVSPAVTRSPSQNSESDQEVMRFTQASATRSDLLLNERIADADEDGDDEVVDPGESGAVVEPDDVEDDLNSTDELPPFEFCTATEAETYMDPNQVRIHRIVNQAVTSRSSVGDCFLGSDDEDEDDGVVDTILKATAPTDRLVSSLGFNEHLPTKQ